MFQRILVPLDGSTRAERAVPVAARLAHASGGVVILVRVVNKSSGFWPFVTQQITLAQQALTADLAEAERYLAGVATARDLADVYTESMVQFGPTVSTLLAVADSAHADLIVLCSHGYTGLTRRMMGSVAENLAREAVMPVLVLREDGPAPGPDAERPLRAIVPLDGTAGAKEALEPAAHLVAALTGAHPGILHLVRVVQPVTARSEVGGMATASAKARRYLSATAEHIRGGFVAPAVSRLNLTVTWSVVVDSYVAEALGARTGETSERADVFGGGDVIALVSHRYDGLRRWAMGNVTEHVLRDSKLPLLIVPSRRRDKWVEDEQEEERDYGAILV